MPHFAPERIEHDEVVGFSVGESQLDVFLAGVRDVEREPDFVVGDSDVQVRIDFSFDFHDGATFRGNVHFVGYLQRLHGNGGGF
jgi:hypothetical protein